MFRLFCKFVFWAWRFRVTGVIPHDLPKKLYVVAPHSSNWDFILGIALKYSQDIDVGFIGKKSLFKFPLGILMKWFGGVPVDRIKSSGFVDSIIEVYNSRDSFSTAMSPEGKRARVDQFKSGFYRIAYIADVPVVLVKFDYANKEVNFSKPFKLGPDMDAEICKIEAHFDGVIGSNKQNSFYQGKNHS